tara:strand:- start:5145 stop:5531 length:387 start_codon:yes stop_codon:yes gene_type:complete
MIEYNKDKTKLTDLERIQIYLAQVQGMILGIITHLAHIDPKITIGHLTTLTYSSESDTIYIYFNNAHTGELVKKTLEALFKERLDNCKEITTDEVGSTFIIELNYGEKELIKYNIRKNLGTQKLRKFA